MPSFLTGRADALVEVTERLLGLGEAVPETVELGYHLCYGDSRHKHFKEPTDTVQSQLVCPPSSTRLTAPVFGRG